MYHREELERVLIRRTTFLALALLAVAPLSADWLVTTDGARVETRGPWTIRGKLVVFELPSRNLASMPLADIDLDASAAATEAAQRAAEAPVGETREPPVEAVLVVTDDDVGHVEDRSVANPRYPRGMGEGSMAGAASGDPSGNREETRTVERLEVRNWDQTSDSDVEGLLITGLLANTSDEVAANIELAVRFLDREQEPLGTVPAVLTATTLLPGQTARFRAEAAGIFAFAAVRFDISSLGLETRETATETDSSPDGPGS